MTATMGDSTIPMAYGTPIDDNGVPLKPSTAMPDLRTATALNGGRSSRILLPAQTSSQPEPLSQDIYQTLSEQGYTRGLSDALAKNKVAFPLNFWIVDNSGSMNKQDGHRFVETKSRKNIKFVECTRWKELQGTVDYHCQMAALLKNPTVFRMLNDPGRIHGPQQFSIAEKGTASNIDEELAIAQSTILNSAPAGVTPLTDHLVEIRNNLLELEPTLRQNGTKVVIVIATDGTPTDSQGYSGPVAQQDFVNALKALGSMPVWIVVRLCTDDESVVNYWNDLDSQLELSLEVLDDFVSEAEEIYEHNKWLNYGLPIHRMREKGFYSQLFDLLDERKLSKDELREFFRIMFGDGKMDGIPDPQEDWQGFYAGVSRIVNSESKQWNPITKRMAPWIDLRRLKRDYGPGWFSW